MPPGPAALRVADLSWRRQKYPCWAKEARYGCRPNTMLETINASGTLIIHPLKDHLPAARRRRLWEVLRAAAGGAYRPLRLATSALTLREPAATPGAEARALALPRVERAPGDGAHWVRHRVTMEGRWWRDSTKM